MLFIIIPAYNEEKNIGRVIRGLFEQGYTKIIVVDDGSVDKTAEQATLAGAIILRHEINRGQGAALQTGDDYALEQGAEIVGHFDADGQLNPQDITTALAVLKNGNYDIVLGSRFLDNRSHLPYSKRYLILPISRWINFVFTGLLLTDAHNGFRLMNRRALQSFHLTQDRMAHNSEMVAQIKKHGLRYIEHPVEVNYTEYGQGMKGGLRIVRDLMVKKITG